MLETTAVYNRWTGLVDWTTGLIDFHLKYTEMLHNVTLWSISMLGNTIFEASSLYCYGADFSISVTTFTMLCSGGYGLEVGEQKNGDRLQYYMHA